MLNARDYVSGSFIKADDVRDAPRREIIENVVPGKYEKLILQFVSGDQLSLNATNTRALMRAYGDDAEAWAGNQVELYLGSVDFRGTPTDSVLVKPVTAKSSAATPKTTERRTDDIPF